MKIDVTQEDIDNGIRGYVEQCPIALAIRRACPDKHVFVFSKHATLYPSLCGGYEYFNNEGVYYDLPAVALNFVYHFDHKFEVSPISFELTGGYTE